MNGFVNDTVGLEKLPTDLSVVIEDVYLSMISKVPEARIQQVEEWFSKVLCWSARSHYSILDPVIDFIDSARGNVIIENLYTGFDLSPRKMQRLFLEQVGLSPKMYSGIIRFAQIYKLIQEKRLSRVDTSFFLGYYDQAHFNREFKRFAGESPHRYFSGDHEFSNFFLLR